MNWSEAALSHNSRLQQSYKKADIEGVYKACLLRMHSNANNTKLEGSQEEATSLPRAMAQLWEVVGGVDKGRFPLRERFPGEYFSTTLSWESVIRARRRVELLRVNN